MAHDYQLQACALNCIRQQQLIYNNLSFTLSSQQALLIAGPNGAGKSSLLRQLTGLATPQAGYISWCGVSIQQLGTDYSKCLHYIGHTNGIKLGLTIQENLLHSAQLALGHTELQNIDQTIQQTLLPLQLHTYAHTQIKDLSAGQKRRVALARLFLIPKPLWILDEPLTALDVTIQHYFLQQLDAHLQQGGMAIMSSHQPIQHANLKILQLPLC